MPATRPEAISNRIRLAYEIAGTVRAFIAKHRAVDAILSAVIDESAPDEQGIGCVGSQDNLFSRADEQFSLSAIGVSIGGIVPFVQGKAVNIAVLCQPPEGHDSITAASLSAAERRAAARSAR